MPMQNPSQVAGEVARLLQAGQVTGHAAVPGLPLLGLVSPAALQLPSTTAAAVSQGPGGSSGTSTSGYVFYVNVCICI